VIASVRGRVAAVGPDSAVVEVGGVGLAVTCTPTTLAGLRLGEEAVLATSLVVREDSLTLYGFADDDERTVFELAQTVTGVGPRLAQAMLAVHDPDALRRAVAQDDLVALTKVPGIGRKGAQRVVLELKDRLGPPRGPATRLPDEAPARTPGAQAWEDQVHAALLGLGWSTRDADEAVAAVAAEVAADAAAHDDEGDDAVALPPDVPALLKAALRTLSRA
jgi:holliday junction DNA helicase RuvA